MRRLLVLTGLIALGMLLGFVVRLIWPRSDGLDAAVNPGPQEPSAVRRTG
jgi:hypothetical protein